ncbi:hypothetical protein QBC40DRAFT_80563 [Triangularia verruculosa]|uniref:C2H2-type domain-containing protein n=1 Tax=Triangularia verruculosa TaxID=2587418 RepID=A0AAN6XJF8_9PEZI|nr:hypothetical protein QBC40DRAFT_80563 [Triangularia verruculosa]
MASNRGPTATEAQAPRAPATALTAPRPLKRARETTPTSPDSAHSGDLSPSKIARLMGLHTPTLTGAAALEEERRRREEEHQRQQLASLETSDNPNHRALEELMSGMATELSRPHDAPAPAPPQAEVSEIEAAAAAAARALSSVTIPAGEGAVGDLHDVSPQSGTSAASLEDAHGQVVDSPTAMDIDGRVGDQRMYAPQPDAQMDDKTANSLSYPGVLSPQGAMSAPGPSQRGMSMPMPTSQGSDLGPRSPGSHKKHKCPYCETEFTRHHNLKSHLLTHSQEKPFVCQHCQMRFRRLHDLKRHGKLHTGEKPHVCPKCDRKFARGDALARHSKGAGGCAGRRPSMGGFGDEDYEASGADDSAMSGVLYDASAGGDMTEEDRRRASLPSIKAQHAPGQSGVDGYSTHSNTYPPVGQRPGGLYPPNVDRGSSSNTSPTAPNSHTPHTSISSVPLSAGAASLYSQSGMTESPKPLSPGGAQTGQGILQRSPHETHQTASGLSLPAHGMSPTAKQAWLSQYPPADRDAIKGNTVATTQGTGRGRGRAASGTAATATPVTAAVDGSLFGNEQQPHWTWFQHFEERLKQAQEQMAAQMAAEMAKNNAEMAKNNAQLLEKISMQEQHIAALSAEVASLREQLQPQPPLPEEQHEHQQHQIQEHQQLETPTEVAGQE